MNKWDGTSFFGYTIDTTMDKIEKQFGESIGPSADGKTRVNWELELEGIPFTLYDWKDSTPLCEVVTYHIGTHSDEDGAKICNLLINLL